MAEGGMVVVSGFEPGPRTGYLPAEAARGVSFHSSIWSALNNRATTEQFGSQIYTSALIEAS